jgi:hypothetical protein
VHGRIPVFEKRAGCYLSDDWFQLFRGKTKVRAVSLHVGRVRSEIRKWDSSQFCQRGGQQPLAFHFSVRCPFFCLPETVFVNRKSKIANVVNANIHRRV